MNPDLGVCAFNRFIFQNYYNLIIFNRNTYYKYLSTYLLKLKEFNPIYIDIVLLKPPTV